MPESKKEEGVLFRPGHYYKKDRSEKVSGICNSAKNVKAVGKPNTSISTDYERSAMGKPNSPNCVKLIGTDMNMDGQLSGMINPLVHHQVKRDGAKRGGKEDKERVLQLEQQLVAERERRENAERLYGMDREKLMREHASEQEAARIEIARIVKEKEVLEGRLKEDEDTPMEEDIEDVYELDEDMIRAGPYYNVRAARARAMEDEVVLGDGRNKKKKEAAFNIKGEGRME